MIGVLKIICDISSILSFVGLTILNCYFWQEKKNNAAKIEAIDKKLKSYQMHVSKDIKLWSEQAKYNKEKFIKFEQYYIRQQSEVNARLKKLEKND